MKFQVKSGAVSRAEVGSAVALVKESSERSFFQSARGVRGTFTHLSWSAPRWWCWRSRFARDSANSRFYPKAPSGSPRCSLASRSPLAFCSPPSSPSSDSFLSRQARTRCARGRYTRFLGSLFPRDSARITFFDVAAFQQPRSLLFFLSLSRPCQRVEEFSCRLSNVFSSKLPFTLFLFTLPSSSSPSFSSFYFHSRWRVYHTRELAKNCFFLRLHIGPPSQSVDRWSSCHRDTSQTFVRKARQGINLVQMLVI